MKKEIYSMRDLLFFIAIGFIIGWNVNSVYDFYNSDSYNNDSYNYEKEACVIGVAETVLYFAKERKEFPTCEFFDKKKEEKE